MSDPEDPWTFDDGHLEELSPRDQDRFEDEFDSNLDKFDKDEIKRQLRTDFEREKAHLKLVKAVAAYFHPKGGKGREDSGFRYVGTNPLQTVANNPADVLLLKPTYNELYFCIICCEIGGETRNRWVDNINEVHKIFDSQENRNTIKSQLGVKNDNSTFQYVTLTRTQDTDEMDFSVLDRNCDAQNYAVWSANVGDKWISHEDGSFIHDKLRSVLSDKGDYIRRGEPVKYTVETHPVFPLRQLVYKVIKEKKELNKTHVSEFTYEKFYELFEQELQIQADEDRDYIVSSEVDRLLDTALKTGIFSEDSDVLRSNEHDYRIMYSGTRDPDNAENMVKSKYFKNMPEVELGRRAYNKTREEFTPEPGLDYFSQDR